MNYLPCLVSNSSIKTFHTCERKFYWSHMWDGMGISSRTVDDDLAFGTAIHELFPLLWNGDFSTVKAEREKLQTLLLSDPKWESYREDSETFRPRKADEIGRMLEGTAYMVSRHLIPLLRSRYKLIYVEHSTLMWVEKDKFGYLSKPDMILEPLPDAVGAADGRIYWEWKTSQNVKKDFELQWRDNPQSWLGAMTAKEELGYEITAFQVGGIVKGAETEDGFRSNPIMWAYHKTEAESSGRASKADDTSIRDANGEQWSWKGTVAKGWKKRSTDEFPGGVFAWVKMLPLSVVQNLTTLTGLVPIDWELCQEFLRGQRRLIQGVAELAESTPESLPRVLDTHFPRQLHICNAGSYGKPCAFKSVCHSPLESADPLGYGWKRRVSHHDRENELRGLATTKD